jgi:hypothetical protein
MNHPHALATGPDAPRRSRRAGLVASALVGCGMFGVAIGLAAGAAPLTASASDSASTSSAACSSGSVCIVPQAVRWQ